MRIYLIACCVAGTLIPYWFAVPFFLAHGADFHLFAAQLFGSPISAFFGADLILASIIFLSWSRRDAADKKIEGWWLVLAANLTVGLSLALPFYLLKRLDARTR